MDPSTGHIILALSIIFPVIYGATLLTPFVLDLRSDHKQP